MKSDLKILVLVTLLAFAVADFPSWKESYGPHAWRIPVDVNRLSDADGGTHCAVCTLVVHLIETYADSHAVAVDDFITNHVCHLFNDDKIKASCEEIQSNWGPTIIKALAESADPDAACQKAGICTGTTCDLVKANNVKNVSFSNNWESYVANASSPDPATVGGSFDWLKELIKKISVDHVPITDVDADKFSGSMEGLRGTHWRGKDCDDLDSKIYPGRKVNPQTKAVDFNCNGISGTNPDTGAAYQDELCGDSNQMGVAVFGDSAGAHFELPPQWMNATAWDSTTFDGFLNVLLDETDLPYKSSYTGFVESTEAVPANSFYKNMLAANRCNHRDFQNLGVNGGASEHFHNIQALSRDAENDHPVMMFLELIGNDVCNHHHGTDSMTTPDEFYTNIVKILTYLDSVVPAGSHLVLVGLADGRVLYETLEDHIHPAGMPYPDFYDFLNCLEISPCWGWMNSDEKVREATYQRSSELNAEYPKIVTENTFKNFDMQYYDFPIRKMLDNWAAEGKDPADLLEPSDGFHPGQIANSIWADTLWEQVGTDHPDWMPKQNPNNDKIGKIFGDQGGY